MATRTPDGSASEPERTGEMAAVQPESEKAEGEAKSAAKRAHEEEPLPEMEKIEAEEKQPSPKKRKSRPVPHAVKEHHGKLFLPNSDPSSMDTGVPPPADAQVGAEMGDTDAAQEEIQSVPPPEKRRKINANATPAGSSKATARTLRPPKAIESNTMSTMRAPSARFATPTQAAEETPTTLSAKAAPTIRRTPVMRAALPETRSSPRLRSNSVVSSAAPAKSPAPTSKIPTSASKISPQNKPPPPEPAQSSRKRTRRDEEADGTDVYDLVDLDRVPPPQKKSLPIPITSPRTTRRTRGQPEIPETPATAPAVSARKSSTTQKKIPVEKRVTRSDNSDMPVPTATKTETSTSRKPSPPQRSSSSRRTAGRTVVESSETPEAQPVPAPKTSSSSRRANRKAAKEDKEHPDTAEPLASDTPATKKSTPRRAKSSRRAAVDKDQEIPETPGSLKPPATKPSTKRRSLPQPTITSSRRTKLNAIEGQDQEQEELPRLRLPKLPPPPSTLTPAARKAILQRSTSRPRATKIENGQSSKIGEDPATPATSGSARQIHSGSKKVIAAEDEIPGIPEITSKIPTLRFSKKITATSAKSTVITPTPDPATTTPPAGRPRRSLVLSPLSHPPPTETTPLSKEKSIESRIPRRASDKWEGKGGLYNIPAEILASHGSVWDGKSGRRISGRTHAISSIIVEESKSVKKVEKKIEKKTEKKIEKTEKKIEKTEKTEKKDESAKAVNYEFSDEEEE